MVSDQFRTLRTMLSVRPKTGDETLEQFRADFERFAVLFPLPGGVQTRPTTVGGVAAEIVADGAAAQDREVIYLHGGGYVSGSLNTHRELAGRLHQACGAPILTVDYRRAPEHPFPAALDDALAVYRGRLEAGLAPERIALAGDSAGGGLCLATLLVARQAGLPMPAAVVCLSPWVDLEGSSPSIAERAGQDPILQPRLLERIVPQYLQGVDPRDPRVSPLFGDLEGLPPLLIQVGTAEILLDDSRRLERRARQQGVEVELQVWEGMIHVWHLFASLIPEGERAIDDIGRFLRRHLAVP